MKLILKLSIYGMCLNFLAACSTMQESDPALPTVDEMLAKLTEQDGRACVRVNDIDGFAALSDSMVSASGRRKQHFLITMLHRCYSLEGSMSVAFVGSFSELCGGGMGQIKTGEESCAIRHIYEFPSREDAFATLEAAEAHIEAAKIIPQAQ